MGDRIILGALSGIIAGIIMGLISMTLHAFNICKLCIIAIGGGIFSGQQMEGYNVYGLVLAWLVKYKNKNNSNSIPTSSFR